MPVLLAYTTTPEGDAAHAAAVREAASRDVDLVVVPITDGVPDRTAPEDVTVIVRQPDRRDRDVVGSFLDIATEIDAELIVIGVKHRSRVGKLLLGSTAQQILLEASAPVLAVKAELDTGP